MIYFIKNRLNKF